MNEPNVSALHFTQLALLGEAVDNLRQVAVFVWDEDRNYVAANDAACELLGRPREEVLKLRVGDLSPNRASPHFENVQHGTMHRGSHEINLENGPVALDWLTCQTRIAGLPYMVSMVWRKERA
jgi:PAS domain-containing protein